MYNFDRCLVVGSVCFECAVFGEEMRDVVLSVIARVQNAKIHTGKRPGGKR